MAHHLAEIGHNVSLWSKFESEVARIQKNYTHPFIDELSLNPSIRLTSELNGKILESEYIVIAIPSHFVRDLMKELSEMGLMNQTFVILSKGIENNSLLTMSEVVKDTGKVEDNKIVTLYGPSHAEEVALGMPTTLVSACIDELVAKNVQQLFSSPTLRIYSNTDIRGVELGGSLKNVFAIAAGICDGIGFGDNTKATLMTRGMFEMTRLGVAMGAKRETFQGLSGIGDVIVTCLSKHSRNRFVGEKIGQGQKLSQILDSMNMVAEGVKMAKSVHQLKMKYNIEMPISDAVYNILFEDEDPKQAVSNLMTRGLISEN